MNQPLHNKHMKRMLALERAALIRLERRDRERAEAQAVERGVEETAQLEAVRGHFIEREKSRRGEAAKPYRRKSGLDWLIHKDRITSAQYTAGMKYADDYRKSRDVSIKSCLGQSFGGDGLVQMEAREEAGKRLSAARRAMLGHAGMISLCDAICGEGGRVRDEAEGSGEAAALEAVLKVALDLLAKHYGIAQ